MHFRSICKCFVLILLCLNIDVAFAAKQKNLAQKSQPTYSPVQSSLVVDSRTGKILHADNAHTRIYPASLTKVMTIYLIFEALHEGRVHLDDKFVVSKYATQALPCKLSVGVGEKITVRDAIHALSIKSANDVARVVAENLGGSEAQFAKIMTKRAHQLGMTHTNFTNASGWHDPKQYSTAVDLAKLSLAIKRDFPQYYHFFSKTSFQYKGRTIHGHNKVTALYPGAEGLKTGYHVPGGCNLITAATRGNKSLVAVLTGRKSASVRDQQMMALLDKHFGIRPETVKVSQKVKTSKAKKYAKKTTKRT